MRRFPASCRGGFLPGAGCSASIRERLTRLGFTARLADSRRSRGRSRGRSRRHRWRGKHGQLVLTQRVAAGKGVVVSALDGRGHGQQLDAIVPHRMRPRGLEVLVAPALLVGQGILVAVLVEVLAPLLPLGPEALGILGAGPGLRIVPAIAGLPVGAVESSICSSCTVEFQLSGDTSSYSGSTMYSCVAYSMLGCL